MVTALLALIVRYTRCSPATGAFPHCAPDSSELLRSEEELPPVGEETGAIRGLGATEYVARWWDKSNAMASVKAIKNAFVEDDDVVIPDTSGMPVTKRATFSVAPSPRIAPVSSHRQELLRSACLRRI